MWNEKKEITKNGRMKWWKGVLRMTTTKSTLTRMARIDSDGDGDVGTGGGRGGVYVLCECWGVMDTWVPSAGIGRRGGVMALAGRVFVPF